jgi:hypothetical protein
MSNHLISATYKRDLRTGTRKAVMVLLADKASDDGRGIYASKQTMADELNLSKQTVIATISGLIADGVLCEIGQRRNINGYTVEYAIMIDALDALPMVECHTKRLARPLAKRLEPNATGQGALPVKEVDRSSVLTGTGQAALPKPSLEPLPLSPSEEGDAPPDGDQGVLCGVDPPQPALDQRKLFVLPDDWIGPAVDDLPVVAAACARQWPSGAYAAVLANFKAHWGDVDRRKRTMRGHRAALANWVIRVHPDMIRAGKAGVCFDAVAALAGGDPVAEQPVLRAKASEDHHSAAIHAALAERLGDRIYQHWFGRAAILVSIERLAIVVTVGSSFIADTIRDRFTEDIAAAAQRHAGHHVLIEVEQRNG